MGQKQGKRNPPKKHQRRRTEPWPTKTERQREASRQNRSLYQSGSAVKVTFGAGTKKDGGGKKSN
ncbi:hypothetical protein A2797_00130 [candidate division WWE3 bacterium RIFCSPHIGHO2_01_FULL_48_15]|uniref:Uncharacterized protein n=1 Tax=candidate division WWE3 bacterium RIFCSPHIGHO2_01_FULL_48_15 TaxID=1802619 RepID=A0A1F4VAF0_UNCKA|nr:MAG: hypothetical protein A2797_00130 [candidate division WWE3 bacterium RIFCSPHIGHO2_01_FULL_48_15]